MIRAPKRSVSSTQVGREPLENYLWTTWNGVSEFLRQRWTEHPATQAYIGNADLRLALLAETICRYRDRWQGSVLDISSDEALLLPLLQELLQDRSWRYATSELNPISTQGEAFGVTYTVYPFHCERDVFPAEDQTFDVVLFCEVLEHLMFDPVWAIAQLNRILRIGGYLLLTTPNAASLLRLRSLFANETSAGFVEYKPMNPHLRHYREYSAKEVKMLLNAVGFEVVELTTGTHRFPGRRWAILLRCLDGLGLLGAPKQYYGETTVCLAIKRVHVADVSELAPNRRWPPWLYSQHAQEKQRPADFPAFPFRAE